MMKSDASDMAPAYRALLARALTSPASVNARTGVGVRTVPGGVSLKLDLSSGDLPVPDNRRYYPHVAAAELAWQTLGTMDASFIMRHAPKMWGKFLDDRPPRDTNDNALTGEDWASDNASGPTIETAYGYRWRTAFGRDQLGLALRALASDRTSRQVYVSAWDPSRDGLGQPGPKNIPCPVGFAVNVVGDEVHLSVFLRSSDLYVGLPYDVMAYALLADAFSASLGVRPGTLHVTLANAHIYEPHWAMAHDDLEGQVGPTSKLRFDRGQMEMPCWPLTMIRSDPDRYVGLVKDRARAAGPHPLVRMPELIE
jgi:thymidylate synthase